MTGFAFTDPSLFSKRSSPIMKTGYGRYRQSGVMQGDIVLGLRGGTVPSVVSEPAA